MQLLLTLQFQDMKVNWLVMLISMILFKKHRVTPVPGGVGPMTVAMLLKNTVTAASLNKEIVG